MNNYEFCAYWILDQEPESSARVLDFGCGAGQIVKELRNRNINAFGCDVFYEGGDYSKSIDSKLLEDGVIRRMDNNIIPFDRDFFDFVVNNQVMEHVEDLDLTLAEVQRVLKPGGVVLSLFPNKGVWREGHCGIPFLHWFPKKSRFRIYYAASFSALGFGHFKDERSVMRWSQDFCEWLDKWTYYRTREEIHSSYRGQFIDIKHIEAYWLQQRLRRRKYFVAWLPASAQRAIVEKLAGMVIVARKPA